MNIFDKYRRITPVYRNNRLLCSQSPQQRFFVVKTRGKGKVVIAESEIMKRFKKNQELQMRKPADQEAKISKFLLEFYTRQKLEALAKIKKHKIDEKLQLNFFELQKKVEVKQKLENIRQSLIFTKTMNVSKLLWEALLSPETKTKLEKIAFGGKFMILRIHRFVREAYFEKKDVISKNDDIFVKYRK